MQEHGGSPALRSEADLEDVRLKAVVPQNLVNVNLEGGVGGAHGRRRSA